MKKTPAYKIPILLATLSTVLCLHAEEIKIGEDQLNHLDTVETDDAVVYGLRFPASIKMKFIELQESQSNWTDKKLMTLRLYRPTDDPGRMVILLRSKTDSKNSDEHPMEYWWKVITANWQGWKELTFSLSDFMATRTSGAPSEVSQIIFQNQFGNPVDPSSANWGIPQPSEGIWGIGQILVE